MRILAHMKLLMHMNVLRYILSPVFLSSVD